MRSFKICQIPVFVCDIEVTKILSLSLEQISTPQSRERPGSRAMFFNQFQTRALIHAEMDQCLRQISTRTHEVFGQKMLSSRASHSNPPALLERIFFWKSCRPVILSDLGHGGGAHLLRLRGGQRQLRFSLILSRIARENFRTFTEKKIISIF